MMSVDGVAPHYRLVAQRNGTLDELRWSASRCRAPIPTRCGVRIARHCASTSGLRVEVAVLDPGSIPRSEGKAVRVIDRRA